MLDTHRKDIHLSLSPDQYDDLTSALETHLNGLHQFVKESALGFGLETAYWSHRVAEVQGLLGAVHRLAAGESPDTVKLDLQRLSHDSQEHPPS